MPRFANKLTGSVVNVSDADAEHLGDDYAPVKAESEDKPARRTRN